ncbi:PREDICTED: uncharacterized protein LOC109462839 [Branchiostoma belcheri]|uniref:Uncharacterized protein LOC109462839 n=1 Tax=Branchiostoma belcheri TaxID=7741 RepID=A0A6P4XSJ9_BRABE|nr:PREDICTED: uncharacterized protein LOC109462839 [Branchiostoma belcheri]
MKLSVMLAVVCLLLHSCLVEGQGSTVAGTTAAGGTLPPGATPPPSVDCYVCSTNVTNDACASATTGSGTSCTGACIVKLEDDDAGNLVSLDRECDTAGCNTDNDNSVFSQDTSTGGKEYEKCCAEDDCNNFSADDLRSSAGKLTAGLAAVLFGAICLLVL